MKIHNSLYIALCKLSNAISLMTEDDINKLIDPNTTIEIRILHKKKKQKMQAHAATTMNDTITALINFPTRNDALDFLTNNYPTKKSLEQIARYIDIPLAKQDKADILREKIIETTTGARIRSRAIKGDD